MVPVVHTDSCDKFSSFGICIYAFCEEGSKRILCIKPLSPVNGARAITHLYLDLIENANYRKKPAYLVFNTLSTHIFYQECHFSLSSMVLPMVSNQTCLRCITILGIYTVTSSFFFPNTACFVQAHWWTTLRCWWAVPYIFTRLELFSFYLEHLAPCIWGSSSRCYLPWPVSVWI